MSRVNNKIQSSSITPEMMMKIDLCVIGVPSLSDSDVSCGESWEWERDGMVLQYLNEVYRDLESADRIQRVRDNHRLWVIMGIDS